MRFYAVIDSSDKSAVIANLVMPLGGGSGGLYYFSKISDNGIAISSENGEDKSVDKDKPYANAGAPKLTPKNDTENPKLHP